MDRVHYQAEAIIEKGHMLDVAVQLSSGKTWRMWGRGGIDLEMALAESVQPGALPVMLGSGLGVCLAVLLKCGPVVVVDRETGIMELTGAVAQHMDHPNLHFLKGDPEAIVERISALKLDTGLDTVQHLRIPLYLRLEPSFYREVDERISAMRTFQDTMRYPRFEREKPRVLIVKKPYFLYREIQAALTRIGCDYRVVMLPDSGMLKADFIEQLLLAIAEFKPDFALTVNHFGMDSEGRLAGLLDEMRLPLGSWFVDSPQLIMNEYPSQNTPGTCVFSFDASSLTWLAQAGFEHVHYLPLATDPERFKPGGRPPAAWCTRVSFVGDSMTSQVAEMAGAAGIAPIFHSLLPELAHAFAASDDVLPLSFLEKCHPDIHAEVAALSGVEERLACEKALTFTAARQYRLRCVQGLMDYQPLIAGDDGWETVLGSEGWRAAGRLDYYRDLPLFYGGAEVSFNCTSVQMKGAVNQRVFDAPACGGFLVTDWRAQMEDLFDLDTEVACYRDPDEIPNLIASWLADPVGREKMSQLARVRILAEHTYEHRLRSLIEIMRNTYTAGSE